MRKAIGFIVFLFVIGVGGYFVLQKYFPNLAPPSKDIKQFLPATVETNTPLKMPNGYTFDVFADLRGEQPSVLTFDPRGTLFASLTNVGIVAALPDFDTNLKPDKKVDLITGLNKPFGIEFYKGYLYIAETNKVSRYKYNSSSMTVGSKELLFDLPGGGKNPNKNIRIHDERIYISVGSSCDACVEKNNLRAALLISNLDGSGLRIFAKGLRSTSYFDFDKNGKIWGADIGSTNLGIGLPPDEINLIEDGKDYGWPYCYGNKNKNFKVASQTPINCEDTESPVYSLDAHTAPTGVLFDSVGNLFVSLHGSIISQKSVGYKIIKLSVFANSVSNEEDYIAGFVLGTNEVLGRPAGLVEDKDGRMFIADNKSGMIYILSK